MWFFEQMLKLLKTSEGANLFVLTFQSWNLKQEWQHSYVQNKKYSFMYRINKERLFDSVESAYINLSTNIKRKDKIVN